MDSNSAHKISKKIEGIVTGIRGDRVIWLGLLLTVLTFGFAAFLRFEIGGDERVTLWNLAWQRGLWIPRIFFTTSPLIVVCLIFKRLPDRFGIATLLILIGIAALDILTPFVELPARYPAFNDEIKDRDVVFVTIVFLAQMASLLLFGITADKTRPVHPFFKFTDKINAWFQLKYDQSLKKKERKKSEARGEIIFGSLMLLAAVVLTVVYVGKIQNSKASERWPTAEGRIVSARTETTNGKSPRKYLKVVYEFKAGGTMHRSDRLAYWDYVAEDVVQSENGYRPNAVVPVYYDANNPQRSVLRPGGYDVRESFGLGVIWVVGVIILGRRIMR